MTPLVQYQIEKDLPQKEIKRLHRRLLRRDRRWHFFHEGSYCLIRTSKKCRGLEKWLKGKKIKFNTRPWEDPHELVRKYQDLFEPVFHSYTILGLIGEDREFNTLVNRVVHCFINMCGAPGFEECFALQRQATQAVLLYAQRCAEMMGPQIYEYVKTELAKDRPWEKK